MIKIPISKILFLDIETVGCCPDYSTCQTLNPKIAEQFESYFDWFQKRFPEDATLKHDEMFKRRAPLVPEFAKIICVSVAFVTENDAVGYFLPPQKDRAFVNQGIKAQKPNLFPTNR
jgi:hypothetical protein